MITINLNLNIFFVFTSHFDDLAIIQIGLNKVLKKPTRMNFVWLSMQSGSSFVLQYIFKLVF